MNKEALSAYVDPYEDDRAWGEEYRRRQAEHHTREAEERAAAEALRQRNEKAWRAGRTVVDEGI